MIKKISGIYRIVCIENGRYYYGSAKNISSRWGGHKSALRGGYHKNPIVQHVWNKHGESSFRIELIEEIVEDKLFEVEQIYLDEHVGKPNCMNLNPFASGGSPKGRQGYWLGKKRPNVSGNNHHRYWLGKISPCLGEERLVMCGEKHPQSKLTEKDVLRARQLRKDGVTYQQISQQIGCSKTQAFRICNKQSWSHV